VIDTAVIEQGLYEWTTAVINDIPWWMEHQNLPINIVSFGTIRVDSIGTIGEDILNYEYNVIGDNLTESVEGPRELRVDVNIFGPGAINKLTQLRASVTQTVYNSQLMLSKLAFIESSEVRNLDEVISSKWVERAQIDLKFYITSSYSSILDRVAHVEVQGEIEDKPTTIIIEG
jgi:hypothetical protein